MENNKSLTDWVKQNAWNLIVTTAIIVSAFTLLNSKVDVLAQQTLENKINISRYPSLEWFELKFKTIDEKLVDIKTDLIKHTEEVK